MTIVLLIYILIHMKELTDYKTVKQFIEADGFRFFFLSRPQCGVCGVVKEKMLKVLEDYPGIESYYVDLNKVEEAAGQLSVFTIPAVLLFSDGHEIIREARYFSVDDIAARIDRTYRLAYE